MFVADATQFNATHVMARVYALYFLNAGIFDEVAVLMDCCRVVYNWLPPRFPNYTDINAITDPTMQRRAFLAFANKWSLTSREKPFNGVPRGDFTTAVVAGLKGAAANPDGTVTSSSLRRYLINQMKDLLTATEQGGPDVPKHSDDPPPAVELVFATVEPPRVRLRVTYPVNAANQDIRLRGDNFRVVASGQTVAGAAWECGDLERGGYLVEYRPPGSRGISR